MRSLTIGCFVMGVLAIGAGYGCAKLTGIPMSQRLKSFWNNDVIPLWRHGGEKMPEPDLLEDIKPEPLPVKQGKA